jgi:hypothetical protein
MQIETDRHMNEEEIERYSLGDIPEADVSSFEEHILVCELCQSKVAESDRYIFSMQDVSAGVRRKAQKTTSYWMAFPSLTHTFATAALMLFLAFLGLRMVNRVPAVPAFSLDLTANRGNGIEAKAPAGKALILQVELAGLRPEPLFRLEMVDQVGKRVWQGSAVPQDSKAAASVPPMTRGIYFLRAYAPSGNLVREYGLEIEGR